MWLEYKKDKSGDECLTLCPIKKDVMIGSIFCIYDCVKFININYKEKKVNCAEGKA